MVDQSYIGEKSTPVGDNKDIADSADVLAIYLADIAKFPLLKYEQEIELAKRISEGDGDAKETLCNSNLRLVVRIAKCYQKSEIPLIDLIQLGNLGLLQAADRYDSGRGVRFSSYASLWIKAYIVYDIKENIGEIHIPSGRLEKIKDIKNLQRDLYTKLDRHPKESELSAASGLSIRQIRDLFTTPEASESLDREINWGNQTMSFGEIVEDVNQNVEDEVEKDDLCLRIEDLLDNLPNERRKEILRLRYGLKDGHYYNFKEIHEFFPEITVQRLQQLVTDSIEKLHKMAKKMKLDE